MASNTCSELFVEFAASPAPAPRVGATFTPRWRPVWRVGRRLAAAWAAAWAARRERAALHAQLRAFEGLSDETLRDIGMAERLPTWAAPQSLSVRDRAP
jgi:hypothetical protein